MKTTMQNQQLSNYLKKKPEIEGDQKQIYEALEEIGPATGAEIAQHLQRQYHRISGRFGELQEKDLIEIKGFQTNSRGYKCKIWKVKD